MQVKHGSSIPPTGADEEYPFPGLCGCEQMFEFVGTGTQDEEDAVDVVVVLGLAVAGGQVYTEVDTLGGGTDGPEGGYLDLQLSLEQLPPGQYLLQ